MIRSLRLALYLVIGLLLGATASFAFAAAYGSTTNKGFPGGAWTGSGTISGTTPQTIESISVGGKYIAVPMLGSLGAAALEAAIIGLKNSPKTVGGPLALGWLASKGIELIGDEWKKRGESVPVNPMSDESLSTCAPDWQNCYTTTTSFCKSVSGSTVTIKGVVPTDVKDSLRAQGWDWLGNCGPMHTVSSPVNPSVPPCPDAYHLSAGACFPDGYVPVGESDWEQVYGNTPPAQVLQELCAKLEGGCNAKPITTQPVTMALSDWKTDPLTGVQTRQVAKITPAPTPENPERVQVEVATETKTTTTTTNPDTGETTTSEQNSETPNENPDFCVLHPDSVACAELGEAEDADLEKTVAGESITPVNIGGAGNCPADKHVNYMGADLAISFTPICTAAGWIKPIVLALAWLAAGYILIGAFKE